MTVSIMPTGHSQWTVDWLEACRRCHSLLSLSHSCAASHTSTLDTWRSQGHGGFHCWQ